MAEGKVEQAQQQYQVLYKGEVEFTGTRMECSTYCLNHNLSKYYRGHRILNSEVQIKEVKRV